MTFASFPLLAESTTRTVLQWGRVESRADLLVPLLALLGLAVFARYVIRRDSRELGPALGWLLTMLRVAALAGLLVIYLQPQWRSEREVVHNSRVLLMVDTSSSMGLTDFHSPFAADGSQRVEHVAEAIRKSDFLPSLRRNHDVAVLHFDAHVARLVSLDKFAAEQGAAGASGEATGGVAESAAEGRDERIDWQEALAPTGGQTRLGQALDELIRDERGAPVSGIVVFSDGGQNAGISPETAIAAAKAEKIPVFTVGLGSQQRLVNVRVYKLEVPPQAHPGDPYSITGLIQAHGLAGRSVGVDLLVRQSDDEDGQRKAGSGVPLRHEEVLLGDDGEVVPVKFELTPTGTGRQTLCLRVRAPETDANPGDDYQEEEIEFVDRKSRVLLFAGGPTREYRFLRTQLYRDASTTVDVLLQTARPGISQEADQLLDEFPAVPEQMYAYDCLVALDPDWQMLTSGQVDLLESWVAEQGGGLIVIAGAIHAGEPVAGWLQDADLDKIRALYPVEFRRQLTVFGSQVDASSEPWPLDFTREGLEAEFLWLGDTAAASQRVWAEFAGVYSCFPVRGPKPGATALAHFCDPRSAQGDGPAVYLAEQFYGSGQVFYLGSGEMWRLRRLDPAHFQRFYTRLIRHVSQGRALRDSSRGALMVDPDRYTLGSTVQIRARLTNPQFEPLEAPAVTLNVARPDRTSQQVTLRADPNRAGMFAGQLTVLSEGTYRLEIPVPGTGDERLARRIKVSLPDLERQNPQRNDPLLSRIALATGGAYYDKLEAAIAADASDPLVGRLKDRTKTVIQTGALDPPSLRWVLQRGLPQRLWQPGWFSWLANETWIRRLLDQTLLWWLMIVLCSLLCCEWLIRRLLKLA